MMLGATVWGGQAQAVTATWGGGTGLWSTASGWSTNPLFPCNGQGGNSYDVVVGSGTLTLDLACTVDSYSQTAGTLNGSFTLSVDQGLSWTAGTIGGSGTTQVAGGLVLSGTNTKTLADTRTLVQTGGTGSWSAGAIQLGGGGATLRNEATWNFTGSSRNMLDVSDTGSFVNSASGILNVDLSAANQTVTLSPGVLQNAGLVNVNVGVLALSGSGTHTGSFAGAGTLRLTGGTQTLGVGANVTSSDLEVSGATLNVDPAASWTASNTDLTSGTLNVSGVADTITSTTATQSGGLLTGPGTFASTGSFNWTLGTMGGSGTTQVGGGLVLSGTNTKTLADARRLVQTGGTGGWSAGAIQLGGGGATLRNEGTWSLTGSSRNMLDISDTGSFENGATGILNVDLSASNQTVTVSTGAVTNAGLIELRLGTLNVTVDFLQTAGALRLNGGRFQSTPPLDMQGGRLEGAGQVVADVSMAGTLAPGVPPGPAAGQLDIDGDLTLLSGSALAVELLGATRGTQYDTVTIVDNVTLGGTLSADVLESFRDSVPATPFIVLEDTTGGTLGGSFANVANGARVYTPALDSFVVRYGVASAFGSDRVVLTDYVKYVVASTLRIVGTSAGGTVSVDVGGIIVDVILAPGLTADQVAAAIANALTADAQLHQLGIAATASGATVETNGAIVGFTNSDPGIEINPPPDVPGLSPLALGLLASVLLAAGMRSMRKRAIGSVD